METETKLPEARVVEGLAARPRSRAGALARVLIALGVLSLLASLVYSGIQARQQNDVELHAAATENSRQTVSVGHPVQGANGTVGTFPANIQASIETPIHARTNGYLKRWLVDIGARVQSGQLLAEIDAPEVDQQLKQAEASLGSAQATLDLDRTTAARYQQLLKSDGVSQQEVDHVVGTMHADEGKVKAAAAEVDRWKYMQAFKQVTAPFAGTITARNVDTGALISAGTNNVLFRLADTGTLRVYTNVPENFAGNIKVGMAAQLEVPATPGNKYAGTVVRTSGTIDPSSRTLLCEVEVPNPRAQLVPGQYGQITFRLKATGSSVTVIASALLFRAQGSQVAVVDGSGKVHLQDVKLGRDFGRTVEVLDGLNGDETIIMNPSDSISEGTMVKPVPVEKQ